MARVVFQCRRFLSSTSKPPIRKFNKVEKCPEGYIRVPDVLDREVLKRNWKSPTGKTIDFVIARPEDFDIAAQFGAEEFSRSNNLCRHLKMTSDEFETLASYTVDKAFKYGDTLMAFWGDKLVATFLVQYPDKSAFPDFFGDELPGTPNPALRIKDDYADDIAKMPFTPKGNRYAALMRTVQQQSGKFLPAGTERLGISDRVHVHESMHNDRIGAYSAALGVKYIAKKGVTDIIGIGVARYSTRIAHNLGFRTLFDFYLKDYKENGKVVFQDLPDGVEFITAVHIPLSKL